MRSLHWRSLAVATMIISLAAAVHVSAAHSHSGPGLGQPVAVMHAGSMNERLDNDSIAMLYSGLRADNAAQREKVRARKFFEVAEFLGSAFWGYYGPDGKLLRQPPFDSAAHRSRIYVGVPGGSPLAHEGAHIVDNIPESDDQTAQYWGNTCGL
jgi:hypothetical protein